MTGLKRFAFVIGLLLGMAGFVVVAGNVLLYLLTGRLPAMELKEDGRPAFALLSPQEVVNLVREQVEKERAGRRAGRPETDIVS
jgi:hypothetical protein